MLLEAKNISFYYNKDKYILKNIDLRIESGERVGIVAPSGYGKSTLSQILAGYLKPISGEVLFDGKPISNKGFYPVQLVYQHPEQALNPRLKLKHSLYEAWQPDVALLKEAGVETSWLERYPIELSGGELQRICIVRALAPSSSILIADEMTAMLDMLTQAQIWEFVLNRIELQDMALIVITHSQELAKRICTRSVDLRSINQIS